MWTKWLILACLLFVGEIVTAGFILFWFAVAAALCAVLAFFEVNFFIQLGVFLVSAVLLILLTKPLTKEILKQKDIPSNVFSLIGKRGIVTTEINNLKGEGQIKVGVEIWSAQSEEEGIIPLDTEVEISSVNGVKLIVKQIKNESPQIGNESPDNDNTNN